MYYASVGDAAFLDPVDDAGDAFDLNAIPFASAAETMANSAEDFFDRLLGDARSCNPTALSNEKFRELVAKGWPGAREILERCAASKTVAPRVGLSSRVGTIRRAPTLTVAPLATLTDEPRPFGAAPVNGRGPLPLRAAPLPSASSMPSQFGPAPFRAPSTMVAPDLQVVANYNTQAGPRVMQQAPQAEGMSNTTMLIIGGAVLAGLFFFSRK